jgi:pyruvate,water dikinase
MATQSLPDRWITDRVPSTVFPHYTRANAGEVLPDPVTPLSWTFLWEAGLVKGCRDGFVSFGVLDYDEYGTPEQPECFGLFGGYFYNVLSQARLMGARMPGATPEAIDNAYFDARDEVPPYKEEPWHQSERHAAKLGETMAWVMSGEPLVELDVEREIAARARRQRPDLATMPDAALLAGARSLQPYLQQMFEHHVWASLGASLGPGALGAISAALGDPTLAVRLIAGIGDVDSAAPSWALWDLSRQVKASTELTAAFDEGVDGLLGRLRASSSADASAFLAAFDEFIFEFGSRGPNEWDLRAHTWETNPELALAAIERMRLADDAASPQAGQEAAASERERLAAQVAEQLAGDAETLATFQAAMASAAVWLAARERCKTNMIRLIGEIRVYFLELGRRMVERGALDHPEQIFLLLDGELDAFRFNPESFTETLRQREQDYLALFELEPPFIVDTAVPPLSAWRKRADRSLDPVAAGTVLVGTAGSGGVVTGTARVIHDPSDPGALEPGDILVAHSTDPAWTPLFVPAGGVVASVGAMGSHTMIVSRELGIPCVVSVEDATLKIPDGATVTVDGAAGTVTVW